MSPELVVVGAGLIGVALSRQLTESRLGPVCVGPSSGPPYSSHDDSGRITRILDASPTWAKLAARAIAEYPDVESRSGVRFHHPVGVLWSARSHEPLAALDPVTTMLGVEHESGLGGMGGDRSTRR